MIPLSQSPLERWETKRGVHIAALGVAKRFSQSADALLPTLKHGLRALAREIRRGRVNLSTNGLVLPHSVRSEAEVPDDSARRELAELLGPVELPQVMLEIDSQIRFSWTLLKRSPSNPAELRALYGALLAHGMSLDRVQVLRMMPEVSESRLSLMMRLLEEDDRLRVFDRHAFGRQEQYLCERLPLRKDLLPSVENEGGEFRGRFLF